MVCFVLYRSVLSNLDRMIFDWPQQEYLYRKVRYLDRCEMGCPPTVQLRWHMDPWLVVSYVRPYEFCIIGPQLTIELHREKCCLCLYSVVPRAATCRHTSIVTHIRHAHAMLCNTHRWTFGYAKISRTDSPDVVRAARWKRQCSFCMIVELCSAMYVRMYCKWPL